jgi:hypothetical protein
MKNLHLIALFAAACGVSTPVMAQSFTFDMTWEPVEAVGGISSPEGPRGGGGTVKGTYIAKLDNGTATNGTVNCVGLDQPDNSMFAIHLSCNSKDTQGSYTSIWGCNYLGKRGPETPLGCVGTIEIKGGEANGQRGVMTMHWYSDAKAKGTGQWYVAP